MQLVLGVTCSVLVEAFINFYFVHCFTIPYRMAHASWQWVLLAGWPDALQGVLLVVAALIYWRFKKVRNILFLLAIIGAIIGVSEFISFRHFVSDYGGFFHGDLIAISAVGALWYGVIGVFALLDFLYTYSKRDLQPVRS